MDFSQIISWAVSLGNLLFGNDGTISMAIFPIIPFAIGAGAGLWGESFGPGGGDQPFQGPATKLPGIGGDQSVEDPIQQQYRTVLGRSPTKAEYDYLTKFMKDEDIGGAEIGQYLQGLPEFQGALLERTTAAYQQKLTEQDQATLQRGSEIAGAQAQSRFAALGRPQSSALAAQVFGQTGALAQDLGQRRQAALADFYGRGLSNVTGLQQGYGQGAIERAYGLGDERRRFGQEQSLANLMYQRQKDMYGDEINRRSRAQRGSFYGGLGGSLLGGAAGFALGGPEGAFLGGSLGSKIGGGLGGW